MNSSTSEALWPSPVGAHEASLHGLDTQTILMVAVAADIMSAIGSSRCTSSTNVSTSLSQDVQYVMALLNQGGYPAHMQGANLVVSW